MALTVYFAWAAWAKTADRPARITRTPTTGRTNPWWATVPFVGKFDDLAWKGEGVGARPTERLAASDNLRAITI